MRSRENWTGIRVRQCAWSWPAAATQASMTKASIQGLAEAAKLRDVKVLHAGTRRDGDRVQTDGGRVLGVTALGDTLADAKRLAYEAVACIRFRDAFYRRDIADKALPSLAAPAPSAAAEPPQGL